MKCLASAVFVAFTMTVSTDVSGSPVWGYRTNDASMIHHSNWSANWAACGGARQSPIDIVTTTKFGKTKKNPLKFTGKCSQYNLTEPAEPLEVDVIGGNCAVTVNSAAYNIAQFPLHSYNMAQFHLHAPSEHTLDGKPFDGEIHFVHSSSDASALLVVGIFLQIGVKSDPWLSPVLNALERVKSSEHADAIVVHLKSYSALVKKASKAGGIYNYPGSLTTPGCDETADWWVVQTPIKISAVDFGRLHQDLVEYGITNNGDNARPTQPLNGRKVIHYN